MKQRYVVPWPGVGHEVGRLLRASLKEHTQEAWGSRQRDPAETGHEKPELEGCLSALPACTYLTVKLVAGWPD